MTNVKPAKQKSQKIRVDFKRTSFWVRFKLKYCNTAFWWRVVFVIFRLVLLLGISYVILFPFFAKIAGSFMSPEDFADVTVSLIPKYPTLDAYKRIIVDNHYFKAAGNTLVLSVLCGVLQTFACSVIGYGFAKFKFRGAKLAFVLVLFTMIVPHQTMRVSLSVFFGHFDFWGLLKSLGLPTITLTDSYWPLVILSITGLGFKNGLYIFMMRQFYRGVPDELEESAYIDGYGVFKTFLYIIIPLSVPMMITIFLFSFSWQWTDGFYTDIFFVDPIEKRYLMPDVIDISNIQFANINSAILDTYKNAVANTAGLMVLIPLIIIYLFCQRYLIQGIERSGLVG